MIFPRVSKPGFIFALTLALATAGAAFAQTPPDFRALFQKGAEAYGQKDWPHCAERFTAAAQAATGDRSASRAFFAAAPSLPPAGIRGPPFGSLDKAAARGYRDLER